VTATVTDAAGNAASDATTNELVVDTTAPTVTSVVRQSPAGSTTNADSVTLRVTFSEGVQNVDAADFALTGTAAGSGTITGVSAVSASVYDVTVAGASLANANGTLGLGFAGGQNVRDTATNPLADTTPTGANQTYTLDNTAPGGPTVTP